MQCKSVHDKTGYRCELQDYHPTLMHTYWDNALALPTLYTWGKFHGESDGDVSEWRKERTG